MSVQNPEETRWQETLQALESVRLGKLVDGDTVHEWMKSWGTDTELDAPSMMIDYSAGFSNKPS